jgi:hypothetical protein
LEGLEGLEGRALRLACTGTLYERLMARALSTRCFRLARGDAVGGWGSRRSPGSDSAGRCRID